MQLEQRVWTAANEWQPEGPPRLGGADLVLLFGGGSELKPDRLMAVAQAYPKAVVVGCSTAGEIAGTRLRDDSLSLTAVRFTKTRVRKAHIDLTPGEDSHAAGKRLVAQLPTGMRHVLVLSDGQHVNGSALVQGMLEGLPPGIQVTGGLAGDGARFQHTYTVSGDEAVEKRVVAVAFYGDALRVGYGSLGGWDSFGPQRRITRSAGNILYELDGQPALALYKRYLGDHVRGLPSTGLLFPLSILLPPEASAQGTRGEVVRTILGVNEAEQSMTFAGDIPQGATARLMKANFDRLVDGAHGAAVTSQEALTGSSPELAVLISCVGRKLVLKQRTEEELEAVQEVLGSATVLAGFYSYGEICPAAPLASCELHNQTMTITTFREEA
ncbi:MAG: FIST signal transduction protein [Thermoplasmatota archaeon]